MKGKLIIGSVLFVIGLLIGFIPQHSEIQQLEKELSDLGNELSELRRSNDAYQIEIKLSEIRDSISLTYVELIRKNYGIALEQSSYFFDRVEQMLAEASNPDLIQSLRSIRMMRDSITAGIAKGEPAVVEEVQKLLIETYSITKAAEKN